MSSVCASLVASILLNSFMLLSVPEHQRKMGVRDQDLSGDLPIEKALGNSPLN